jgi:transcriptional regulator with XRE-family HTH domain
MPALVANSVGVGAVSMPIYSQIANGRASRKICRLRDVPNGDTLQTATMETEKNGGTNYLQAWREFRRMSREELAAKVDTTGAVIWHLEQGERALSAKWLRRLAPALGTKPGLLLDHDPNNLPTDVFEIWGKADDDERRQITALAETVIAFRHKEKALF